MMKKNLHRLLGGLLAAAMALTLLASALYLLPTNDALMLHLLGRNSTPAGSALPDRDYPRMAEMICAYLRGETKEFQLTTEIGVETFDVFSEREQQHMADVQALFGLCRGVAIGGLIAFLILVGVALALRSREMLRGFRVMLAVIPFFAAALALWAVVDFESLFILFHEVMFTNDLWLLDPKLSMLIRLMPTAFFVDWVTLVGCAWMLGMALALLGSVFVPRMMNKGDGNP